MGVSPQWAGISDPVFTEYARQQMKETATQTVFFPKKQNHALLHKKIHFY